MLVLCLSVHSPVFKCMRELVVDMALRTDSLQVIDFGKMSYGEAWSRQKQLHQQVVEGLSSGFLIFVEHASVITMGKHSSRENLLLSDEDFNRKGVEIFQIDRGGEVTAHMPGQLVIYPILNLRSGNLGPKKYVAMLESMIIRVLASYGIEAGLDSRDPGVWVDSQKVCAIGIRVKQRVTMHGIALNINNSLDLFQDVVPCGIKNKGVTTMSNLLGHNVVLDEVKAKILTCFAQVSPFTLQERLS